MDLKVKTQTTLRKGPLLNKVKKRLTILPPSVQAGMERESCKSDFYRDGDKCIGKGGFGEVWRVIHKATNKVCVIKVIDKANIVEQNMIAQLNREIEIMYKVNHPHLMKLYTHFEDDDKFYLVMPFASKGQLYSLLKKSGRFDERTAGQYIRETIEAVKYLHSFDPPIIHRDIKPENILLDENGRVLLSDFGWSNFKDEEFKRNTYCGTPEYLGPEMVGKQGHDLAIDIWSIGVLMFELLAGHAPFTGSSQKELFNNIQKLKINWPSDFPPLAKNVISKILRLNPKERISLDEITSHAWFDKNPPKRPVLIKSNIESVQTLSSYLLGILTEAPRSETESEVTRQVKTARVSQLQSNNNEMKNLIEQQVNENLLLTKDLQEIKIKFEKLENEHKALKLENAKLKELTSTHNNQEELRRLNEELDRYKVMNRDRLDLLSEIEERNNEIFELKNKLKSFENEIENLNRKNNLLNEKILEQEKSNETQEIKISELNKEINDLNIKKDEIVNGYQKKVEILQMKLVENTNSEQGSLDNVLEILNENISEIKMTFYDKMTKLANLLNDIKDDLDKKKDTLHDILVDRSAQLTEVIIRSKSSLEEDLQRIHLNAKKQRDTKNSEMIEWLKKQIAELQQYKNKTIANEYKINQLQKNLKLTQTNYELSNINLSNTQKILELKEEKLKKLQGYTLDLEAKLSDVKHFVFKNCDEKLDEFTACFGDYYNKL